MSLDVGWIFRIDCKGVLAEIYNPSGKAVQTKEEPLV